MLRQSVGRVNLINLQACPHLMHLRQSVCLIFFVPQEFLDDDSADTRQFE